MNNLILGDCLEVLKKLDSESVDLIYLDPPFFSNRNYEVIWGDKGEVRSFEDRWSGGVDHYIAWLKERVEQMHRVLKPTGSIFLHCDWHANAYIRVFILDKIFGEQNFKSDITWKRTTAHNTTSKKLGVLVDNIFWFSKSDKFTFYSPRAKSHNDSYADKQYKFFDKDGRKYRLHSIERNPALGIRPNLIYEYKGYTPKFGWMMELVKLEQMDKEEKLYWNSKGTPQRKIFLDEVEKPVIGNLWDDIFNIQSGIEKIGYPTQKPEALLERIINMASNEDDIVLDPFNGGGTTVAVADRLNRQWIGIDSSVSAIKVTQFRLEKKQTDLFAKPFTVQLHKYDYDTLRYKDAFEFEKFIVQQVGGTSNAKQRNDLGLDGKTQDGIPIQVKRSDNIGRNVIDNFQSACKRFDNALFERQKTEKQPVGVIIAFSFGKGATQEVARLKNQENVIIQLLKVEDIIPIAKKPTLSLQFSDLGLDAKKLREIEFSAVGESEAGIEFYAWDWNYENNAFKFDIVNDKIGKQTQKFKAGTHCIAVKVVDNDGLESIEVITLKFNGAVSILTDKQ
jgi:DNA modification methylase